MVSTEDVPNSTWTNDTTTSTGDGRNFRFEGGNHEMLLFLGCVYCVVAVSGLGEHHGDYGRCLIQEAPDQHQRLRRQPRHGRPDIVPHDTFRCGGAVQHERLAVDWVGMLRVRCHILH